MNSTFAHCSRVHLECNPANLSQRYRCRGSNCAHLVGLREWSPAFANLRIVLSLTISNSIKYSHVIFKKHSSSCSLYLSFNKTFPSVNTYSRHFELLNAEISEYGRHNFCYGHPILTQQCYLLLLELIEYWQKKIIIVYCIYYTHKSILFLR